MWLQVLGEIDGPPEFYPGTVLDVGCRDLCSSFKIAEWLKEDYYGVDVSAPSIISAKYRSYSHGFYCNLRTVHGKDFGLCFGKTFDVVMASCMVYHLTDELAECFFQALPRLLKPEGIGLMNVNTTITCSTPWKGFPFVQRSIGFYKRLAKDAGLDLKDRGPISDHGYKLLTTTATNNLLEIRKP